ncbi:glycoside hydrolase family 3 C-terminal domain-containing protein [Jiangella endophytica]|uniref:glycoside hydrolase family 3 C-terminal domain-containing protein n=1 Tax=Jiangella endophytica TaxID=1623398 RepID=UPI000E341AAC|nr:glycoside hydrolase family 3 C-terminal domain-containing protein [Jiangella endophytica]
MLDSVSGSALDEQLLGLVEKLSLQQQVRLLTGADFWHLPAEPAIGLRSIRLSDGPSGIRGISWEGEETALNLPSATALGAGWDPALAYRYGTMLAAEARRMGADVVLGPTINLHRSPLGGRHFEAYSEDPLLTSRLAAAYVRGVQDGGVGACPKHYVANDFENDRHTANVVVSDRALRELYLAAFEDTVVEERPWLVMSAYNGVNGATMTENPLLAEPLCGEWGFDGVVVSDWGAVTSTEPSALARQDVVMPGPDGHWGDVLVDAVRGGRVPAEVIAEKVLRVLRLAARVGALDGFGPGSAAGAAQVAAGPALAREVAADGMVLVRNEGELPWDAAALRSVAVVGHNAFIARSQGGGSAHVQPDYVVSPLEGLRRALPDADVRWELGALVQPDLAPLPAARLTDPVDGTPGVRVVCRAADGTVVFTEHRRSADLARFGSTRLADVAVVELSTSYVPEAGETVRLGVAAAGHARLSIDGVTLVERQLVHDGPDFAGGLLSPPIASAPVEMVAGRAVTIEARVELPERDRPDAAVTLIVGVDLATSSPDDAIVAAVEAARRADVVVAVVGTSSDMESESFDRTTLALPGRQDELVSAVAAANPRTVVVVNAGAPVLMPWRDEVAAVVLAWFGGQEVGHAIADVLLGASEPGGRLPTTWPATEADVPVLDTTAVDGDVVYDEGVHVGYRAWLRDGGIPAYPFGAGHGYTTWDLSDPRVEPRADGGVDVHVTVRNTGSRAGKHVVQAYLSRPGSAVGRPVRWLAGFAVVRAAAGAEQAVTIQLRRRVFEYWEAGWHVEPGEHLVQVGHHVDDLPLVEMVTIGR